MKAKKKSIAKNLSLQHHNNASSYAPNRLRSTYYQKIITGILIVFGSLVFIALNSLAYYFGWKYTNNKPNTAIQILQKIPAMFEKQTDYTTPRNYACDPNGVCNNYSDPKIMGCPKTFSDPYCSNTCNDPKIQCTY